MNIEFKEIFATKKQQNKQLTWEERFHCILYSILFKIYKENVIHKDFTFRKLIIFTIHESRSWTLWPCK